MNEYNLTAKTRRGWVYLDRFLINGPNLRLSVQEALGDVGQHGVEHVDPM